MRDIIINRVFEYLDITSPMEADQRIAYMQRILRGVELKKYKAFLMECKQSANDRAGGKWTLGYLKALSTEDLWTWVNSDGLAYNGHASYLGFYKCI